MKKTLVFAALSATLTGCSPIIPDETVALTATTSFTYAQIIGAVAVAAAAYYIVDPLAPNWQIEEQQLGENRYRISMKKKRFTTGGDGEALDLFKRRAEQLVAENGYEGYRIMGWTEGVQSDMPIAQRWSQGVIELQSSAAQLSQQ